MKNLVTGVIALAVIGAACVCFYSLGQSNSPSKSSQRQVVDNEAALRHIDERLASMSGSEKAQYLALQACATDTAMVGVYDSVQDNPLLQRQNDLNDRYNSLYKQLGAGVGIPDSLSAAEDKLCPGDHPVG